MQWFEIGKDHGDIPSERYIIAIGNYTQGAV
jgi:hypothetical protein